MAIFERLIRPPAAVSNQRFIGRVTIHQVGPVLSRIDAKQSVEACEAGNLDLNPQSLPAIAVTSTQCDSFFVSKIKGVL